MVCWRFRSPRDPGDNGDLPMNEGDNVHDLQNSGPNRKAIAAPSRRRYHENMLLLSGLGLVLLATGMALSSVLA